MTELFHVRSGVVFEDGLVVARIQSYGQSKMIRSFWVSCPQDGPQPPWILPEGRAAYFFVSKVDPPTRWERNKQTFALCGVCKTDGPLREAIIPIEKSGSHERCTRKCINGKSNCNCGCRGRCHGEGRCYCEEP